MFLTPDFCSINLGSSPNFIVSTFLPGSGWSISWSSIKRFVSSRPTVLSNSGTISFIALCNFATSVAASALAAVCKSSPKRWSSHPACVPAWAGFNPYKALSTVSITPPSAHLSSP